MNDTIAKALDFARAEGQGDRNRPLHAAHSGQVCPSARPVKVAPSVMERNRLLTGLDDQRILDCYSLLRTRVLHRVKQGGLKTLGITSPSPQDGKSLTATNLAISIAFGESHPVLLVDADFRRPSLAGLFGLKVGAGLGDYLTDEVDLDDIILQPPVKGLYLVPGRDETGLRPESLSSEKIQRLITRLKQQVPGGLVIMDMPPALVGGDVALMAPNLDAALLVVANRRTYEHDMEKVTPIMEGVNVIGTVLNFADQLTSRKDYYSYKY